MLEGLITGVQRWSMHLGESDLAAMGETSRKAFENSIVHPAIIPVVVIGMLALVVFIVFINDPSAAFPSSTPSAWLAGKCTAASPATSP